MLRNYIKVTFRNMFRNKLFTTINILGLSVSIASCLLLFLYVSQEINYDSQHGENVYRLNSLLTQKNGSGFNAATSSVPIAPAIKKGIPEIIASARVVTSSTIFGGKDLATLGDESFYIEGGVAADSSLFKVLRFDIIRGDADNLLPNGNSIVLEKKWSEILFGTINSLGKELTLNTELGVDEFEVTGIYDSDTYNSHLQPSFIISTTNTAYNNLFKDLTNQWVSNNLAYTYVKLTKDASVKDVEAKIDKIFIKNGAEEMKAMGLDKKMILQPVTDIHVTPGYMIEPGDIISMTFIRVLIGIGILILILACVNYINLSTAQAGNRALEVGIRKVMGVTSKGLISQFLGESFIIVFISLLFSILLAELTLPVFNQLVDHPIAFTAENFPDIIKYMALFILVIGFAAGVYPAIYLASFKPTTVLKGKNRDKGNVALLRKGLVTLQFVISIVLISSILIIAEQVEFIKNKDLGFDTTSKVVVPLTTPDIQNKYKRIKQGLLRLSQVHKAAGVDRIPGKQITNDLMVYKKGETMDEGVHIFNNDVDVDFVPTLDINLITGENFNELDIQDSLTNMIIINKMAMKQLGLSEENVIGEQLYFDFRGETMTFKVKGVMEDINQFSLHQDIAPVMLSLEKNAFDNIIIDTDVDDYASTMAMLSGVWKELIPEAPFEAFALTDELNKQYESDFKTFNLIKYFAVISVFISCMGLYALSMFIAERRFKEIGVRKTLGADVKDIVILISKDLSLLVVIAFVVSIPISVYGMNLWLESFAFKITPSIGTYILAGGISILIGWATISHQSVRAAQTNPINVLKDE